VESFYSTLYVYSDSIESETIKLVLEKYDLNPQELE